MPKRCTLRSATVLLGCQRQPVLPPGLLGMQLKCAEMSSAYTVRPGKMQGVDNAQTIPVGQRTVYGGDQDERL